MLFLQKLHRKGIHTIEGLAEYSLKYLKQTFGPVIECVAKKRWYNAFNSPSDIVKTVDEAFENHSL